MKLYSHKTVVQVSLMNSLVYLETASIKNYSFFSRRICKHVIVTALNKTVSMESYNRETTKKDMLKMCQMV